MGNAYITSCYNQASAGGGGGGLGIPNMLATFPIGVSNDGTNVTYFLDTTGAPLISVLTSIAGTPQWFDSEVFTRNIYNSDYFVSNDREVDLNGNEIYFEGTTDQERLYLLNLMLKGDSNIGEIGYRTAVLNEQSSVTGWDFRSAPNSIHPDFSASLRRNSGENGNFVMQNLGTGATLIYNLNGAVSLLTNTNIVSVGTWFFVNGTFQSRLLTPTTVPNGTTTFVFDVDSLNGERITFGASHPGCVLQWQATDSRWINTNTQEYVLFINNLSSNNITFDTAFFAGNTTDLGTGQHVLKCQYDPQTNKFFVFQPTGSGGGGTNTNFANANLTADADRTHAFAGFDLVIGGIGDFQTSAATHSTIATTQYDITTPDFRLITEPPITNTENQFLVRNDVNGQIGIRQMVDSIDISVIPANVAITSATSTIIATVPAGFVGRKIGRVTFSVHDLGGRGVVTTARVYRKVDALISIVATATLSTSFYYTTVASTGPAITEGDVFYVETIAGAGSQPNGLAVSIEVI